MRNLKKFLALVLAMMMAFSLMITANASYTADSDFSDAESITEEFAEAVSVLEGLEVFEGYEDGSFKPKKEITRAETAAIVYRLATGDVDGSKAHLYKDYQKFKDVVSTDWYAGYVNYCSNAEWIKGYGDGNFGPNNKVTGYQAAAMILRAVGYGKNGEFNGTGWQVQVANFTRSLGLLENVDNTTYASTLNQPATRELVAEILFQAGLIPTVTWTPMNGYQPGDNTIEGDTNAVWGLAWQNFRLDVSGWRNIDKWGHPGYYWYTGNSVANNLSNVVATIELDADLDLDGKAVKECDVAHELGISTNDTFDLYVNRNSAITTDYLIEATDTVTRVGGQGRDTKFYKETEHPWDGRYGNTFGDLPATAVMVDTYLATVTKVTERVLDPAGHVIVPAYLYLDVYDGQATGTMDKTAVYALANTTRNTSEHRISKTDANWEYAAGDKVLIQGYTDYTQNDVANVSGLNHQFAGVGGVEVSRNRAAFEANRLRDPGANYANDENTAVNIAAGLATRIDVLEKVEPKLGKQTMTYWNQDKHTVDGADYSDHLNLYLDVAGTNTNTTFAWYFDKAGNLIGIDNVPDTVNYGVITSIYSAFTQGDSATSGTAKAIATVLYADGSTGTVTIDRFLVAATALGTHAINQPMTATTNSADLTPVYDYSTTSDVMKTFADGTSTRAQFSGNLYVAPIITVNDVEAGSNTSGYHGILRGNLFKFVSSSNGTVTAIEVAGQGTGGNTGVYANHWNVANTTGKLFKNSAYIDLNNPLGGTDNVRLDSDTYIMVRTGTKSVSCYTIDTLPGDVTLTTGNEVDIVDSDGDNRAEYVYVTGSVIGTETYGLFYYNGGAAQWNGVDGNGTIVGYLNGELTTLTFGNLNMFNRVRDSQTYTGHLFAIRMVDGVVMNLLENGGNSYVLTPAVALTLNTTSQTVGTTTYTFAPGAAAGNPYTATTTAINVTDNAVTPYVYDPTTRVVYLDLDGSGTFNAGDTGYYLNGNSKVYGLGMGVTQESAILDYLNKSTTNDVTIVYEPGTIDNTIVEIYVATDPNVTPPTTGSVSLTGVSVVGTNVNYTVNNNYSSALSVTASVQIRLSGTATWSTAASKTIAGIPAGGSSGAQTDALTRGGSPATYEVRVVVSYFEPTTGIPTAETSVTMTATF